MEDLIKELDNMIKAGFDDRKLARGILSNLKTKNKEQRKFKINLIAAIDILNRKTLPDVYPNSQIEEMVMYYTYGKHNIYKYINMKIEFN